MSAHPRRLVTGLALTVLTVLAAPVPLAIAGNAAAATAVAWRPHVTPAGAGFWSNPCPSSRAPQVRTGLAADDAKVEAGVRLTAGASAGDVAWAVAPPAGVEAGPALAVGADVQDVTLQVDGPATGRFFGYYTDSTGTYYGTAAIADTTAGWHALDATTGMRWYKQTALGWAAVFNGLSPTWTLAQFAHDRANPLLVGYELGCGSTPAAIDHLSVASTAGTTDYDLTNALSRTTISADHAAVTGAAPVTLTGAVTDTRTGAPITAGTVAVLAEPYGAGDFATVATIAPGASYTVTPATTTTYRLAYSGSTAAAASSSGGVTVTVTPTIDAHASATRTTTGTPVTISGGTRPARQGVPVTLQHRVGGRWATIASATTGPHGGYAVTLAPDTGGTWTLRARLAASDGNGAATSSPVSLDVRVPTSLSARLHTATIVLGAKYTIAGAATPAHGGATVTLQRRKHGSWHTLATATLPRSGRYSFSRSPSVAGTIKLRVVLAPHGSYLGATSPTRVLTVKPKPVVPPPPTGGGSGGSGGSGSGGSGGDGGGGGVGHG